MNILGINVFHYDASSCLIVDNKIVAAIEEERFQRIKHYSDFPIMSLKHCLDTQNLKLEDIDYIAVNYNRKHNFFEKIDYSLDQLNNINIYKRLYKHFKSSSLEKIIENNLNQKFHGEICYVPHHTAHIASSFYISEFESAIGLSIDGTGDFSSMEVFTCEKNQITLREKVNFPHSIGILYQSITQLLGFKEYGDEYKVMGMSAYGKPIYLSKFDELFKFDPPYNFTLDQSFFNLDSLHSPLNLKNITNHPNLYSDKIFNLFEMSSIEDEKDEQKIYDIASSLQKFLELIVMKLVRNLHIEYDIKNLCLSGGVIFNSALAGKLSKEFSNTNFHISTNSGDAGGALGAALFTSLIKNKNQKKITRYQFTPFLGTEYSESYILDIIKNDQNFSHKLNFKIYENEEELLRVGVELLINESLILWFQSKMEWGPRALGNRSFLADPRIKDIKELINSKIKLREKFRPFAPSIIKEYADDYFFLMKNVNYNYMTYTVDAKEKAKKELPGVVHVDGTSRIQTVTKEFNKIYYNFLMKFYEQTDCPALLNTSLNIKEPIVESPINALNTFLQSDVKTFIIGKIIIRKNDR